MHELSVCIALLDQVETIARDNDARVVTRIALKIGPLSGVEPALLRHAYPLAAAGTVAEKADLVIDEADIVVRCSVCDTESTVAANRLLCAQCGDFRTRIVSGDDMILERVELEKADAHHNNVGENAGENTDKNLGDDPAEQDSEALIGIR